MVELKSIVPNIKYDLRYATTNNFTGVRLYPSNTQTTYLRKAPAEALARVAKELSEKGMGILVWDAFRPFHVTVRFWELIKDERYVANPAKGSKHNRGCAVDLTLIDLKTGKDVPMPTPYDSFAPEAAPHFQNLPKEVIKNRDFLIATMQANGFKVINNEWWHFDFNSWQNYDLMDIPFEKL